MVHKLPIVPVPPVVPAGLVYFVRHGLVRNPDRLAYAWLPRFHLHEEGRGQAQAAAEYLADKSVRLILTSPLLRARQTARIVSSRLPGVPVRISRFLIEGGLAHLWQGTSWEMLPKNYPDEWRQWQEAAGSVEFGESMAAMANRMRAAMVHALQLSHGGPAVCISHRDPILALRLDVEGRSFDELHTTGCDTASITAIQSNQGRLRLVNYVEHSAADRSA